MLACEHHKREHFVSTDFFFGPTHVRLFFPPKCVFVCVCVCVCRAECGQRTGCLERVLGRGEGNDGWWVGDWRTGWWVGVCVGRLDGWLFVDVNLGVQRWGYCVCVCVCVCVCTHLHICLHVSQDMHILICQWTCACVCVLPVRRLACVCVFFCFALGCWVMGPAGRAEAIHFPSATLKAASREGGSEGAERIKQRRKSEAEVEGGMFMSYFEQRERERLQSDGTERGWRRAQRSEEVLNAAQSEWRDSWRKMKRGGVEGGKVCQAESW